jgi:glycosyltransferase involved in cell wall biosynthesis
MDAITICAANYLPFVNVLGNSFLSTNPDSTFSVLVIDSEKIDFAQNTNFRYLSPGDLDIPENVFKNMTFYYNVTELATALKPSAMKALFRQGSTKVIYLDPDIQVFSELTELDSALDENPIVLTPHTLNPIPRDGLRPTEADIMGSGTFNLGFLGLSKSEIADELLNWWEERLRFDSISDPSEMLFTDQRWMDFVPSYFPIYVLRHPGYNIAYWNLHERELSIFGDKVKVNNENLRFFHFSGYRPEKPWILSKYVSDNPRIVVSKDKILASLCENYGKAALESGWRYEDSTPYGFANFENGKFIPSSIRRLYRDDCKKAYGDGEVLNPPSNWQAWATDRSYESGNLSRILFSIWKSRPDLKRRYPDATGTEARDLITWAKNHGIAEKVIDEDLLKVGLLSNDEIPTKTSKSKGINISGYLTGELGVGQSARLINEAAQLIGLPVTTVNSNRIKSRKEENFNFSESELLYPLTIAVVNADHFKLWVRDFGSEYLKKTKVIGVWAWELEDFPAEMHEAFQYVDEIWAVSEFVKDAISKHTRKPVFVLPTPIISQSNIEKLNREKIGLPETRPYNLFIFDYMSSFNRKNPLGLVQAHLLAFPDQDGPLLVIKSMNGNFDSENREKLRFTIRNRTDVLLIEEYLSRKQLTALINECEAYISLHRSEGYGLTIAEAMSLGKPVIATAYSGNMDFMNNENSFLVPFKMTKVGSGSYPYDPDSNWANPDSELAAQLIQLVHRDKISALKVGTKAQNEVTSKFNLEVTKDFMRRRIDKNYNFVEKIKLQLRIKLQSIMKIIALLINKLIKFAK